MYNNALRLSGYKENIMYEKQSGQRAKNRSRKLTLFNPPFKYSVDTNGARMLSIERLAPAYNRKVRKCQFCLLEKSCITFSDQLRTTNNMRNEIVSKFRQVVAKNCFFSATRFIEYHLSYLCSIRYTCFNLFSPSTQSM